MTAWYVYILQCADDSLYTGITTDPKRRVREHNQDNNRGAAYTRGRRPVVLAYQEVYPSRTAALKRELEIKALKRESKLELVRAFSSDRLKEIQTAPR